MFGFLQGFAYGLFASFMPWFIIGMINPPLVLPTSPPHRRWQVIVRYLFLVPFIGTLSWLTSLWGGFDPAVSGWLAGLLAIPTEIFIERRWRRWYYTFRNKRIASRTMDRLKARAQEEREKARILDAPENGLQILDSRRPPNNADDITLALCDAKRILESAKRPDLAVQADRLYTRYQHIVNILRNKFDPRELTYERAYNLVAEVCRGSLDTLSAMGSLAQSVTNIDADFARRRLSQKNQQLSEEERLALSRRLSLLTDTDRRLLKLSAQNEAAMTTLDDAAIAIAGIETSRAQASVAAEQALQDLRRFADKAQLYGRDA